MFLIYGKRKLRIKTYTDHQNACNDCKFFDLEIKIFKEYFHLFFVPFFPTGAKSSSVRCRSCGTPTRIDSLQKQYEDSTRVPFYLYSGLIVIFVGIALLVNANLRTQKEKKLFVENPQRGDVYLIRTNHNDSTAYYFLRINRIIDDTVLAWHSNLVYSRFVSKFDRNDFFVKNEELIYTKSELKKMLEGSEINAVERGYGDYEGFNRIK